MSHIAVVGAGLGGLSVAIRLAAQGHRVEVFEQNAASGGKLWGVKRQGYNFTYGPSTLTMPELYQGLLEEVGIPGTLLQYQKLSVNHRDVFSDGRHVDATTDSTLMMEQLQPLNPSDAATWPTYKKAVERMASLSKQVFFERSFTSWRDYLSPRLLSAFVQVHPLLSMDRFHHRYFSDPRVLMMFNRYATYVGSDPRRVPATLAMIGGLEYGDGVYTLKGGAVRLVTVLSDAALKLGVDLRLSTSVEKLYTDRNRIVGLEAAGERLSFDAVVYNGDHADIDKLLHHIPGPTAGGPGLGGQSLQRLPHQPRDRPLPRQDMLSLSGFVLLIGVRRKYRHLHHHTVFYPEVYFDEFDDIFHTVQLPANPTIYICNSSYTDSEDAPQGGSNLFVLVNVPAMLQSEQTWQMYEQHILRVLETRCSLEGLRTNIEFLERITPNHLMERTSALNGAIYGSASHGLSAFRRPSVRSRRFPNLYFVGGTNHPGGGTPMVALGAKLVAALLAQESSK